MSLLIFNEAGRYDVFTATSVDGDSAQLTINAPAGSTHTIYPAGSSVVEVIERTFALRVDTDRNVHQLVSYDGPGRPGVPLVDNVVALRFEYFGDPRPPQIREPGADPQRPSPTYGPRPPPAGVKWTAAYPEGENCTFTIDADGTHLPRLPVLVAGSNPHALVRLIDTELTDGPWCPDSTSSDRFDADLLRIRAIAVTIRVQAAPDTLRGPRGALFFNAGTATRGSRWVPDQQVRFEVTPRNLNLAR
jgi:hypothetical protein